MAANRYSPGMVQYHGIKAQYPDAILFYRMGDFYEMFEDDAVIASEALGIALTSRGKGSGIPMCGVPAHSSDTYLQSLIHKGFRVAICEQVEDVAQARKRGSKAVVERQVVRLVTPGTLTEDSLLDAKHNNYLASISHIRDRAALAWVDLSTGRLRVIECPVVAIGMQLARINASEILVAENLDENCLKKVDETDAAKTTLAPSSFDSVTAEQNLAKLFEVRFLDAFGNFSRSEFAALGAIVSYLQMTQQSGLPQLQPPVQELPGMVMLIDSATRRNLELVRNQTGGRDNTLLSVLDRTHTAAGARLLEQRISSPSTSQDLIATRQDSIAYFIDLPDVRSDVRSELRKIPDFSRALSRLCLGRGGPHELASLRLGLIQAVVIYRQLQEKAELPMEFRRELAYLPTMQPLADELDAAIVESPPSSITGGGFVNPGYSVELDELRDLRDESRTTIARLQKRYADMTGISSLKIRYNNVLGYFIETKSGYADEMFSPPNSENFIHRQTLAKVIRFTSAELSDTASRILNADDRACELERQIFEEFVNRIMDMASGIATASTTIAKIDVATSLAELASMNKWCRPAIDIGTGMDISAGRHPVVEQALRNSGSGDFIANDCSFSGGDTGTRISLVTGPNMSGKSTFLRQNALIVVLAQAGSYVPAQSARIGIVSSLFSRVGAADELASGRSTFMVEMLETATILHQSNRRSLVILDEIGRGTATFDGLSIAWATLEYIHEAIDCRTLFATHYHELTDLSDRLSRLSNLTVEVREWDGELLYMHKVKPGSASRSYGIEVARLAGMPHSVVDRAFEVLNLLEGKGVSMSKGGHDASLDDLPLFAMLREDSQAPRASKLEQRMEEVDPDSMTPLEALNLLYELQEIRQSS